MQRTSLTALAALRAARKASSGRSSRAVRGGRDRRLRLTLVALREGEELAEHANPMESIVQVLNGRVLLTVGEDSRSGGTGDIITVPDAPHRLTAVEDSTVLLSVVELR